MSPRSARGCNFAGSYAAIRKSEAVTALSGAGAPSAREKLAERKYSDGLLEEEASEREFSEVLEDMVGDELLKMLVTTVCCEKTGQIFSRPRPREGSHD